MSPGEKMLIIKIQVWLRENLLASASAIHLFIALCQQCNHIESAAKKSRGCSEYARTGANISELLGLRLSFGLFRQGWHVAG